MKEEERRGETKRPERGKRRKKEPGSSERWGEGGRERKGLSVLREKEQGMNHEAGGGGAVCEKEGRK